ncbi:MAG: cold-shock protein [Pigmentiphaga sp.]
MFVPARAIIGRGYRHLNPEQLVEFNTEAGSQGPQAVSVQPVVNGN